jgi:hypothetical protein
MMRANPNIVEEDDLHTVERYPKAKYIKVDDRHIRNPIIGPPVEFYREDDKYYYIYTYKRNADMDAIVKAGLPPPTKTPTLRPGVTPTPAGPARSEMEDLSPPRVSGRLHLEEVKQTGLPPNGLWRASFVMADMNGDGIPDIVAPSARLGNNKLNIWIGDGKGGFKPWTMRYEEDGKPRPSVSVGYGGVAVGDIDGDGNLDVVVASHGAGLISLFGDGTGGFRAVRKGLPTKDFSSQAIALINGDKPGKLDIAASIDGTPGQLELEKQIRVFEYAGKDGWKEKEEALVGGFYSNSLNAWDYDRDGKLDLLTGSHYIGALTLLWKNMGNGHFEPVRFPEIEIYCFHFATAPGTFGADKAPAFADGLYQTTDPPNAVHATAITVYSLGKEGWVRHRVWRKKEGKSAQWALAMGDIDGDGLDDIVFPDSEVNRLRVFFQNPDGTFVEAAESEEPKLESPGQCVRLADLNGDGKLDIVLSKTVSSTRPSDPGGWSVFLNRR